MPTCAICGIPTEHKCTNCNQTFYCGKVHQKQHWLTHKVDCRPFKVHTRRYVNYRHSLFYCTLTLYLQVEHSDQLGRYLVATRSIKPFEIILKEAPLLCTPSQVTSPVCLGCLNGIEPSDYIDCENCGWPLCGIECKGKPEHEAECEFTVKRGSKVSTLAIIIGGDSKL